MLLNGTSWTVWFTQPPVICALLLLATYWIVELVVFLLSPPPNKTTATARRAAVPRRTLVSVGGPSNGEPPTPPSPFLPAPILSPTDRTALRRLRERVRSGEVSEGAVVTEHTKFARWLVQRGRVSEWDEDQSRAR